MPNTALGRTNIAILTNKSGGALTQGDTVVIDTVTAASFTTTTTSGYSSGLLGIIIEPNGIANNATGLVAFDGYVPKVNLSGSASLGDLFKSHTVAGQAVRHAAPMVTGDFGMVLGTGTTPAALLFGKPHISASGSVATDSIWDAKGDLAGGTGADTASRLAVGANDTILVADSAQSTGMKWRTGGKLVQVVSTQSGAVATGSTVMPFDDTIPQNTEGDEYMTRDITPTSATNDLYIDICFFATVAAANIWHVVALFQDTTAGALAAIAHFQATNTAGNPTNFRHKMAAGTTSSTTFKVRAGPHTAGTMTFNGQSGGRLLGGVMASSITVTEVVP